MFLLPENPSQFRRLSRLQMKILPHFLVIPHHLYRLMMSLSLQ
jgi:hypothetical protein